MKAKEELGERQVLRRYLDLAKFIDLLRTKKLYLRRADLLADKFEGSLTPGIKAAIQESYDVLGDPEGYEKLRRQLRTGGYINCWTLGLHDNMAMWAIYGKSNASIAITTTVRKLKNELKKSTLDNNIKLFKVEYVNHWKDPTISIVPLSNIFKYKLEAYSYEQEVRIVYCDFNDGFIAGEKAEGVHIDVCLNSLLRSIVVSADAEPWFIDLINDLVKIYKVDVEVRSSKLASDPF